ncbi:hypothetical protein ACT16_14990 [Mycobacterium heckeshornense]|nr:hypothetical protein ACT16_14990 [Mycobacterium heckeshornense]
MGPTQYERGWADAMNEAHRWAAAQSRALQELREYVSDALDPKGRHANIDGHRILAILNSAGASDQADAAITRS